MDKKIVIYPGTDLTYAVRCVESYIADKRYELALPNNWMMYTFENRDTGEWVGPTIEIYTTKTQIVVKGRKEKK